jgi:hypothetical protein
VPEQLTVKHDQRALPIMPIHTIDLESDDFVLPPLGIKRKRGRPRANRIKGKLDDTHTLNLVRRIPTATKTTTTPETTTTSETTTTATTTMVTATPIQVNEANEGESESPKRVVKSRKKRIVICPNCGAQGHYRKTCPQASSTELPWSPEPSQTDGSD